jgi:hypothetical protein
LESKIILLQPKASGDTINFVSHTGENGEAHTIRRNEFFVIFCRRLVLDVTCERLKENEFQMHSESREPYLRDGRMGKSCSKYCPIDKFTLWMLKIGPEGYREMSATDPQEELEASEPHVERDVSEAPLLKLCELTARLKNIMMTVA